MLSDMLEGRGKIRGELQKIIDIHTNKEKESGTKKDEIL
jgi:hypothetical protein